MRFDEVDLPQPVAATHSLGADRTVGRDAMLREEAAVHVAVFDEAAADGGRTVFLSGVHDAKVSEHGFLQTGNSIGGGVYIQHDRMSLAVFALANTIGVGQEVADLRSLVRLAEMDSHTRQFSDEG